MTIVPHGPGHRNRAPGTVDGVSAAHLGPSPLLSARGAVAHDEHGLVAWHYGDPLAEQRGARLFDGWGFGAVAVQGPDRLSWLDLLASQDFSSCTEGWLGQALWLSPQGRVEHWAAASVGGIAIGSAFSTDGTAVDAAHDSAASTESGSGVMLRTVSADSAAALADFLLSRRFRSNVTVTDMTAELGFLGARGSEGGVDWRPVPRDGFGAAATALIAEGHRPSGTWARDALEISARQPAFGIDSDGRTVPNEIPAWMRDAVAMDKGCYCGQETVARIANVGAPPRRLVLLNLDGSADRLPAIGADLCTADGKVVGRVGRSAQHWEDGPVALALVKRTVAPGVPLHADGVDALIDPDDVVPAGPKQVFSRGAFLDLRRR